jgi:hypothetical protein
LDLVITFKGEKMKTLLVIITTLFLPATVLSQGENKTKHKDYNIFSLNVDIYLRNYKDGSPIQFNTFALIANYQRTIITSGSFGMSGEVGIGLKYPQGSSEFMLIDKTANLFIIGNYFKNRHKFGIGFGGIASFQDGLLGTVKFRYINFVEENKFVFISFNQVVWYSSGYSNTYEKDKSQSIWFWDSGANDFILSLGIGLTF